MSRVSSVSVSFGGVQGENRKKLEKIESFRITTESSGLFSAVFLSVKG